MIRRVCAGALVSLLVGAGVAPAASADMTGPDPANDSLSVNVATGGATPAEVSAKARAKVTVTTDVSEVVEGDQMTVRVKVANAKTARKVTLQEFAPNRFGALAWTSVGSRRAAKSVKFPVTVTVENTAKYRALVSYKKTAKPVKSNTASVTVWRWISLENYAANYSSGGAGFTEDLSLGGRTYLGWSPYASATTRMWETGWPAGRHCKAFKGIAGLASGSDIGSTGTVSVVADGVPVWQSPVLTPGTALPFETPIPTPDQFMLRAVDASTGAVEAFPAVGDPELLCTGV